MAFTLYHAAKPRKGSHLVAKVTRRSLAHSLTQAHQSQSEASPLFLWVCAQGLLFPLLLRVQTSDWKDDVILGVFSDLVFLAVALWWLE